MQNLAQPNIPVQEVFYSYGNMDFVYTISKLEKCIFYSYQEKRIKDRMKYVHFCQCILTSIFLRLSMSNLFSQMDVRVKTVIIQMLYVFLWHRLLADVSTKIEHIFPIRNRSFNVSDRDVASVKRKIRRQDRIFEYTHNDRIEFIQQSSNTN